MDIAVVFVAAGVVLLVFAIWIQGRTIFCLQSELEAAKKKADLYDELQKYVLDWTELQQNSLYDLKAETVFMGQPRPREPHHQKSKPDTDEPSLDLSKILPFGDYDFDTPPH